MIPRLLCHTPFVAGDIKMIKLIANITVERLQDKTMPTASGATPTNASVTPTIPPASRPIDFSEFRSRLQHAYNIPTPKITVSCMSCDSCDNHVMLFVRCQHSPLMGPPMASPGPPPLARHQQHHHHHLHQLTFDLRWQPKGFLLHLSLLAPSPQLNVLPSLHLSSLTLGGLLE